MKSKIKILGVLLALIISTVIFTKQASAQQGNISYQIFYDQLGPYGQWVDYHNYGYVWIPDAGPDFFPYSSDGHWIFTEYGWTWVSYYDWGWAPFHYGRWDYDNYYGWFWVPDNEWGPAWVTWRRADGYYGWSPMEPGISISFSFGPEYRSHNDRWIFVRDSYIDRPDIYLYYVNRNSYDRIYSNSRVISNTYVDDSRHTTYVSGPKREDVQQITGRRVKPVAIQENDRPGQNLNNGQLKIYRPQVVKNNEMERKPAPSRVVDIKEVKPPAERNVTNQPQNVNQSQKVKQSDNNRQDRQPGTANQPQNVNQSQKAKQSDNNKPDRQTNTANPQNNNKEKSPQQVNTNPSPDNKKVKQSDTAKPADNKQNEQKRNSKSEQERKKNK